LPDEANIRIRLWGVAFGGTITQIVAAVLPCQLGYTEIAAELAMTVAK
jgi:thiaminase